MAFFTDIRTKIFEFVWKYKNTSKTQSTPARGGGEWNHTQYIIQLAPQDILSIRYTL